MKYRKKPVEIEAIQWKKGTALKDIDNFMNGELKVNHDGCWYIETLEGDMFPTLNDYIIKGVKGEFYPCKPDIFEMTYEKVEE
ncbi:hypothetical protein HMPREF3291_05240 [Bacillus sp. HMSC76G11]|nr:hypothetical protein HMPREF3291_05240 [Bacillus sp. HMSC76G11]